MSRVVVVGAGVGGLAAAARLRASGHRVTVLEQAPVVGGKLGRYERDGFAFDTGPSLLTLPAVYRDLFLATGAPIEDVLDIVPVDPTCRYRFPDGSRLEVPNASRPAIRTAMNDALGGGAGDDWDAFLQRASRVWDVTRGPFLESPLQGWRTLAALSRDVSAVRTVAPWASLRDVGEKYLRDPRLRMFLDRYATYTGSDPRRAPAALATIPYVEQTFGSWYVRGGLRRLGDAILGRVLELGADVRTSYEVSEVVLENGRVAGVRSSDGELLPADVVVANVDATHLYGDLVRSPRSSRALRRATPSLAGFVLLLALRGRSPSPAHHQVLFPADYDDEFDSVFGRRGLAPRPVPDPAVYLNAPDDPALRPDDGHEAWFVLVNAPRHDPGQGVDWSAPGLADSYADRVLAVMAERGVEVRDRLLWREVRTPADLETATRSPGGSIYGSSSNGARSAFLRPANRSPVPGLFLVGGSSHPGGGLPLVGLSAAIVADLVGSA